MVFLNLLWFLFRLFLVAFSGWLAAQGQWSWGIACMLFVLLLAAFDVLMEN